MSELCVGEPDPKNDEQDAQKEFRNGVPTSAQSKVSRWWEALNGVVITFAYRPDDGASIWRECGHLDWQNGPAPQPLKPHRATWQRVDNQLSASLSAPGAER